MPRIPYAGKQEQDLYMEPEEYHRFLRAARKDATALLLLRVLGMGGLRTIEVTWLKISDLDKRRGGIWVTTAKRKKRYVRFVALDEETMGMLHRSAGRRGKEDAVVLHDGEPIGVRRIRYLFQKYRRKAGVNRKLGPHSLRHMHGIVLSEKGYQPQEIAQRLGHKKLEMVLIYANLRQDRNTKMADAAAEVLLTPRNGKKGRDE